MDFDHGPNGVTRVVRDCDGRDGSFQYLHLPANRAGERTDVETKLQKPRLVSIFSVLRQLRQQSGRNDKVSSLQLKP